MPDVPADVRHLVSVLATGFVLFTLLVQATTLRPLISWLWASISSIRSSASCAPAPWHLTQGEILDRLSETAIIHGLDLDAAEEIGALYRKRLATLDGLPSDGRGDAAAAAARGPGNDHLARGHHYTDEMAEGTISRCRRLGAARAAPTSCWMRSRTAGVQPYRKAARAEIGARPDATARRTSPPAAAHQRPLARRMAQRIELRLIQRRVLEGLTASSAVASAPCSASGSAMSPST